MAIDREDIPLLINMIRQFRIAISNMRLYPTESVIVQTSIKDLHNTIATFLSKYKFITIGFVDEKPIVNKEDISKGLPEPVNPGIFLERLNEHNIKTVSFRQGLEFSELIAFLELIKQRYDPAHSIREGMRKGGIKHIGVNEKVYTAIGDKDLVIERGEEILAKDKGALDAILSSVERIVDMTLNIENPSLREKLKLEIGKRLLFKDPKLLEKLVGKMGGRGGGPLENLSIEEVEEHLAELIETYRLLKDGKVEEVRDRLKELIRNVTGMLKKMDPTYELSDTIANIDKIDDFAKKWERLAKEDMVSEEGKLAKKMLSESSFDVLCEKDFGRVINAISERGAWKVSFKIIKKVLMGMESLNPGTRQMAITKLNEIMDVVFMNAEPKEFYLVFVKVLKAFIKETSQDVLDALSNLLPELLQEAYERGLKREVLKVLAFINMEVKSEKSSKERINKFRKIKRQTAELLKDVLLEHLLKSDKLDAFTLKAFYYLGDELAPVLVERLKETSDEVIHRKITRILWSIGPVAEPVVLAEIEVEQSLEKLQRLLDVIDKFKDKNAVLKTLETALLSAPSSIKPVIFSKLIELGGENLEDFALDFMEQDNPNLKVLGFEYMLKNAPDKVKDKVESLLVPKKVLFLKFQQREYIKVKKRVVELIGDEELLWGIPMVIPQLAHQDRGIKKAAYGSLQKFKPEILKRYEKEIKQLLKDKDPITRDYTKRLLEYIGGG